MSIANPSHYRRALLLVIFLFGLLGSGQECKSQWWKDTVWTRDTYVNGGFYMLKFSKNDSIIVGHNVYDKDFFYDAATGNDIGWIWGNNEVFFINNDRNFIRLRQDKSKFEIFDTKTFSVIDSLESDATQIVENPPICISKDERYLSAGIQNGFRIWNTQTKKIFQTKIYPYEENLVTCRFTELSFTCDNKLIGHINRTYQDPEHPGDSKYYKKYVYYIVYDVNSLDSIGYYPHSLGMYISPNCKYYATQTGDGTYGVEIYDFNTKQLLWKIPVNTLTLTGLEFSPDDKYLVTSSSNNTYGMTIWDMTTGKEHFHYDSKAGYSNINISHDGIYLVYSASYRIRLMKTHFDDVSVNDATEPERILYPNPTTNSITLTFELTAPIQLNYAIYSKTGQLIKPLIDEFTIPGKIKKTFDLSCLPAGTYFLEISGIDFRLTFKVMVVR